MYLLVMYITRSLHILTWVSLLKSLKKFDGLPIKSKPGLSL